MSSEQPRSKLSNQGVNGETERFVDNSSTGALGSASSRDAKSNVQFMWLPLSEISYPTVTLLASFDVCTCILMIVFHYWQFIADYFL